MKAGVIVFPGSNCDHDCHYAALKAMSAKTDLIWHKETKAEGYDLLVVPGGFSYGDYLRTGSIARFSPVMNAVIAHAQRGGLVLGICNGFQILLEAGLLPGAMLRNRSLQFICEYVHLRVESVDNPFFNQAKAGQTLRIPIAHGEGNYYADEKTLRSLEDHGQILVRYCDEAGQVTQESNPNGSCLNIAGICNTSKNVFGLMPHPERAIEKALGSQDGLTVFKSIVKWCTDKSYAQC